MALIEWSAERFSVHIAQFDDDHRQLIHLINDLHSAMKAGQARDILHTLLEKLGEYAQLHMRDEEVAMERHRYPALASHRAEHMEFADHVSELRRTLGMGDIAGTINLLDFLRAWLFNHMLGTDRLYVPFLVSMRVPKPSSVSPPPA